MPASHGWQALYSCPKQVAKDAVHSCPRRKDNDLCGAQALGTLYSFLCSLGPPKDIPPPRTHTPLVQNQTLKGA